MYLPAHFAESRREPLHALIEAQPLATLVTLHDGSPEANHLPLLLAPEAGPLGTLQGHVARSNPVWQQATSGNTVLAIFSGPQHYITPNWYPTKQEHGRAVPTWNYVAVHVRGVMRTIDDPLWLRAHLDTLTARHEASQPQPWAPADAPPDFIERLLGGIVGIEIEITQLLGKWKVSQNQPPQNRAGIVAGLNALDSPQAGAMATLVGCNKEEA